MRLKLRVLALVLLPFKQPKLLPGMSTFLTMRDLLDRALLPNGNEVPLNLRTLLALARTSADLGRRRWLNGLVLIEYSKLVKQEASPAFAYELHGRHGFFFNTMPNHK